MVFFNKTRIKIIPKVVGASMMPLYAEPLTEAFEVPSGTRRYLLQGFTGTKLPRNLRNLH